MFDSDGIQECDLRRCLLKYWGYQDFREHQVEACMAILSGRDCFYMTATGSGKSMVFLLPTIALSDKGRRVCTFVISPLISLMQDQVQNLTQMNIKACMLNSDSNAMLVYHAMNGEYTFIYSTPEKALSLKSEISQLSNYTDIVCCAVDESHCVVEWGGGFRPEYRNIYQVRESIGKKVPIVALTASATTGMERNIVRLLRLDHPLIFRSSINRNNLKYLVKERFNCSAMDVVNEISDYRRDQLRQYKPSNSFDIPFVATLIYTITKKCAEEIASLIAQSSNLTGISVAYYHSGLSSTERARLLKDYLDNRIHIVVATTAFGMGINKPDIRLVIHYGLPLSVESYYQQSGRGGRDGFPTLCILLWSRDDAKQSAVLIDKSTVIGDNDVSESNIANMKAFATGYLGCRRKFLMNYFDESFETLGDKSVGDRRWTTQEKCCDLCDMHDQQLEPLQIEISSTDIGYEVYMLLMTLYVMGTCFSLKAIISILLGRYDDAVKKIHDYKSFEYFGCGIRHNESWWRALLYQIMDVDHFVEDELRLKARGNSEQNVHYFVYRVTSLGEEFLKGGLPVVVTKYSKTLHHYSSELRSQLLRIEIENEIKSKIKLKHTADVTCVQLSRACGPEELHVREKKPKIQKNDELFHIFTDLQQDCAEKEDLKKIQMMIRNLMKRERLLIAEKEGINVHSILSSNDIDIVLDRLISLDFVSKCLKVDCAAEVAGQMMDILSWDSWKMNFANRLASAIVNGLTMEADKYSKTPETVANENIIDTAHIVSQSPIDYTKLSSKSVNLYRPSYQRGVIIEKAECAQDLPIVGQDNHEIYLKNHRILKSASRNDVSSYSSTVPSTSTSAASKAHKKRISMTGLGGYKSRIRTEYLQPDSNFF